MDFPFLDLQDTLKLKLLLQADDYGSYNLVEHTEHIYDMFGDKVDIKFHYKIFRNYSRLGELPDTDGNEVTIDGSHYYVYKKDSNVKDRFLFTESIIQMCLQKHARHLYFQLMRNIQNACFLISVPEYKYKTVEAFPSCLKNSYTYITNQMSSNLQEVNRPNNYKTNCVIIVVVYSVYL